MDVVRALRRSGITIEVDTVPSSEGDGPDAVMTLATPGHSLRFAVEQKRRAPYPNELTRLAPRFDRLRRHGHPMLVMPFASEELAARLTAAGWSWADAHGNFDVHTDDLWLRQRRPGRPRTTPPRRLPQGSGSLAIIRSLIGFSDGEEDEVGATALAAQAGVSQPRASQVLRQLRELGLLERSPEGRWRPDREALLDRFVAEYRGPGGSEHHFYALDTPSEVALAAARTAMSSRPVLVSADVGADLLTPWRRPTTVVLYARHEIPASELGLVDAEGAHAANVIVRAPDDRSVFPTPALVVEVDGTHVPLVDPTQMIWDLHSLGGEDRVEAAGVLREWLLRR